MREITVKRANPGVIIYVGKVDQNGKYEVLRLTEAEAAALAVELKYKLEGNT